MKAITTISAFIICISVAACSNNGNNSTTTSDTTMSYTDSTNNTNVDQAGANSAAPVTDTMNKSNPVTDSSNMAK